MSNLTDLLEGIEERIQANERWRSATLSAKQVVAQNYNAQDLEKLVSALANRPLHFDAPFRLWSFIVERQESRISNTLRQRAADNVADIVRTLSASPVGPDVFSIFAAWGVHRADYYETCLQLLQHPDESTRSVALALAPVFLQPKDYCRLIDFRLDASFGETAMGGPLRFGLRDEALSILEKLTGFSESGGDCFEGIANSQISYRSWSPFLIWWESHQDHQFRR